MQFSSSFRRGVGAAAALLVAVVVMLAPGGSARAATTINGGIDLGTAADYGVLGGLAVTNTGATNIDGWVGVSPGSAISGFPPGLISAGSEFHSADAPALQAKTDLRDAMNTAASLTPMVSGLANLTGMSLGPGVYSGGALLIDGGGTLTLQGGASSVWVFTAASTLTTGSMSHVAINGGASICNVFWLVGSSATLGTGSDFVGTVMAEQSVTATTGTTVLGRLLASNAAVTLDATTITRPTGCVAGTTSTTGSPELTSGEPTDAVAGTPYSFAFTATGTPLPTYALTAGTLPAGVTLDATSGLLSGTPLATGVSNFTITASNGVGPAVSLVTSIETLARGSQVLGSSVVAAALLPDTGTPSLPWTIPVAGLILGAVLVIAGRRTGRAGARHRVTLG